MKIIVSPIIYLITSVPFLILGPICFFLGFFAILFKSIGIVKADEDEYSELFLMTFSFVCIPFLLTKKFILTGKLDL